MKPVLIPVLIALVSVPAFSGASPVPYGHPDFYPSAERPAQLRGLGDGQFPAATPVTKWDFKTGKNIIWRCPLPGWGYSSPIVVGDKAFVTCDWNKLICIDVRTGKILWVKTNETYGEFGDKADDLRATFEKATGDWLTAWQCCWEIGFLTWKLDVIKAGRAGTGFTWPKGGYGHAGHAKKGGLNVAPDHITRQQLAGLLAKAKALDDAEVKWIEARLAELQAKRKENEWGPAVNAYVPRLSPYVRGSKKEKAFKNKIKSVWKKPKRAGPTTQSEPGPVESASRK